MSGEVLLQVLNFMFLHAPGASLNFESMVLQHFLLNSEIESLEEELKAARSLALELQDTQTKEFAAEVTSLEATVLGLQDELQLAKNKAA
jgi:hypothetical protein